MHHRRSTSVRNSVTSTSQGSEHNSAGNLRSSGKVLNEGAIVRSSSLEAHFLQRNQNSNTSTHNLNDESTPAAAARLQLDSDNNEEVIRHSYCSNSQQRFHHSGLTDPTETDLTETTRTEDFTIVAQEQQEVAPQRAQTIVESSSSDGSNINNNKAARSSLSLSDLIQRLQSVTRQGEQDAKDGSVVLGEQPTRGQASASTDNDAHHQHNMSVEQLVELLSQLNESQMQQLPTMEGATEASTTDRKLQVGRAKREQETPPPRARSPDDHAPLLPLSELIDRLHQVNASEQEHAESSQASSKMHRVLHRNSLTTAACLERQKQWSVAELTRLLHHINHVQAPSVPSNPAFAEKQASSFLSSRDSPSAAPLGGSRRQEKDDARTVPLVRRGFSSKRLSTNTFAVHSLGSLPRAGRNFSWTTDDDNEFYPDTSNSCFVKSDEPSLSPEDLFDPVVHDDDDASGFSVVVASSESICESSVTWYDGSDIDEITVDSNRDDGAALEEIFFFEHHHPDEGEHDEQQQPVNSNTAAADV